MNNDYLYPGTDVLKSKGDARDAEEFRRFEVEATAQRLAEGIPPSPLTPDSFRQIHRHIFQDVFDWAGEFRTVDVAKGGNQSWPPSISAANWRAFSPCFAPPPVLIARRLTIDELNNIHPFREGNGQTMRAFLERFGSYRGHEVDPRLIEPAAWLNATIRSLESDDDRFDERDFARLAAKVDFLNFEFAEIPMALDSFP